MLTQLSKSGNARKRGTQRARPFAVRDFDRGKNSREENDKILADQLDTALNVVFEEKNIVPRKGTQTLATKEGLVDIGMWKLEERNKLFGIVKEDGVSRVALVDRDIGTVSNLMRRTAISLSGVTLSFSPGDPTLTNIGSATDLTELLSVGDFIELWYPNFEGGDIIKSDKTEVIDVTATTVTIPAGIGYSTDTTYVARLDLTTVDFSISGQFSFDSGAETLYITDGTSIIAIPNEDEKTKQLSAGADPVGLTLCDERLWVANKKGNLRYSQKKNGLIDSFAVNNENNTGGASSTGIDKILAITSTGRYVIAMGRERIEVHSAPMFQGGELTFGNAPMTLVASFDEYGIESSKGFLVAGGVLYFVNKGGFYRYLVGSQTPPEHLNRNRGEHLSLGFDRACMSYDVGTDYISIACRDKSLVNNYGIFYKVQTQEEEAFNAFSNFNGVDARSFAGDADDTYFLQEFGGVIKNITGTDDDGDPISCEIASANLDNGDMQRYKKAKNMFMEVASAGTDSITYDFLVDTKDGTVKEPSFTYTLNTTGTVGGFLGLDGFWGIGHWGIGGFEEVENPFTYQLIQNKTISRRYARAQCRIKFSTTNSIKIRAMGWYYTRTDARVGNKQFL